MELAASFAIAISHPPQQTPLPLTTSVWLALLAIASNATKPPVARSARPDFRSSIQTEPSLVLLAAI